MENRRRIIRLEVSDFLAIKPLNEVAKTIKAKTKDLSPMGMCFVSNTQWHKGQVLLIDYYIPEELDSVEIKSRVVWSEFVDTNSGYFCGVEVINVEPGKEDIFYNYYSSKLKEMSKGDE